MDKTAIDIILEGVSNGSISQEDAKILLEAINKPPQTVTVPYNTVITTKPDWDIRSLQTRPTLVYNTGTDSTPITNKNTTNG
jgi:hypothetical protein